MYAIEKELRILRQFISPKHMEGLKKWKCYSEDEILAAAAAYQKYWKKRNIPLLHASLNIHKLEHEPRFNHAPDAYGLFLVIHAIREWEEMSWREHANDRTCLFSDFFPGEFSMEYFQRIADRIKDDFKPLSDHPELIDLGGFPLQMAYAYKNQDTLLILGQEPVCFMLLIKAAAGSGLLEKVQEQTGLAFHVGF